MSTMNCPHCKGTGIFRRTTECNDCKATGAVAYFNEAEVHFQGQTYRVGDKIPFLNSRGRQAEGRVTAFFLADSWLREQNSYPAYYYPLRVVWCDIVNTGTGKASCYPLWKSIPLQKLTQLFPAHAVPEANRKQSVHNKVN